MARLHDVPVVLRTVGAREFARRVAHETLDDGLPMFAGSLAYAWLLAIFPFLIFVLNVVPLMPRAGDESVARDTSVLLHALLPDVLADAVWRHAAPQAEQTVQGVRRGGIAVSSLVVALWIASGGVTVTMAALDKCYELDRVRPYYARRPMAFFLTLAIAALVLAMIVLLPLGAMFRDVALARRQTPVSTWTVWAFDLLRGGLALAAAFGVLGLIYHFGPCVKRTFRPVTPGAVFCMIVWILLGLAFKEYVNRFSGSRYEQTYGAAGWVVILLVIFYLDALVLLIGAEINSEIDFAILGVPRGSRNYRPAERARAARAAGSQPAVAKATPRDGGAEVQGL